MNRSTQMMFIGAIGALTTAASAQTVTVIYSEIAGDPTAMVPAGADVPAGTLFDSLDRPYRSLDGSRWIISASTNLATSEDEVIIVGSGMSGMTVVREGTAFGSPTPGELVGLIERNMGIADNGNYTFATNTDGPTASDEYIVRYNGASFLAAAQEGMLLPGSLDSFYGSTLDAAGILNDGLTACFRAPLTTGALPSEVDDFVYIGAIPAAQSGISTPLGQFGVIEAWDLFDANDFYVSASGLVNVIQGDLTGDTTVDDIVAVNNIVAIQEGFTLPLTSMTSPVETIVETTADPGGDWYSRGDNDDQQDWVVRNGAVVALTNASITNGSSETYSDLAFTAAFFWMSGNDVGDYVVGGTTSNADEEADAVLVLNGTTVLARQGDPVDLDGNGVNDDGVFLDIFNNDDGFLTNDGRLYFTAELRDVDFNSLGQAFLVLDTTTYSACTEDIAPTPGDGAVDFTDLLVVLSNWGACPMPCETSCPGDVTADCMVGFDDLVAILAAWGDCP